MDDKPRFKKILLVVPPFYRLMGGKNNWVQLGLGYIASFLNKNGHAVKVYNADHANKREDLTLRQVFEGYENYRAIVNDIGHPIWQEIRARIAEYQPDLIGITVVLSATLKCAENIATVAHQVDKDIKIVLGGPHATMVYEDSIKRPWVDYVVRQEGEHTMLELIRGDGLAGIKGLSYKDAGGEVRHNPARPLIEDLNSLPFPDPGLQLMPVMDPENNFGMITTSRGCSLACVFCSSPRLWNRKVRFRSVDNVVAEMEFRHDNYGVRRYYFCDDNISINKRFTQGLCRSMIDKGWDLSWSCEARVRSFDEETLVLMKKAGCKRIKLGVESGSDKVLKFMRKGITVKDVRETVALIEKVGIDLTIYILLGMPVEEPEDIEMTYGLLKEIEPAYVSLSVATPHIGSELWDIMEKMNIDFPEDLWTDYYAQSGSTILNKYVTPQVVDRFLKLNERKTVSREIEA
ncbi:MAG: radical SAM protein [Candidatus Omnitrophica bacterium]|nr:radical SAM protein [Candidatus Omnitrophota bacterium]